MAGDDEPRSFIRGSLTRSGFLPYLDRWEADAVRNGAGSQALPQDEAYVDERFAPCHEAIAEADEADHRSREASATSARFVLTTLLRPSACSSQG